MSELWRHRAACNGYPTEWWFPDTCGAASMTTKAAVALCRRCPVAVQCLQQAVDVPEYYGIWGGVGERQRRTMRRVQTVIVHGSNAGYSRHQAYGEEACPDCKTAHSLYQNARRRIRDRAKTRDDIEEVS